MLRPRPHSAIRVDVGAQLRAPRLISNTNNTLLASPRVRAFIRPRWDPNYQHVCSPSCFSALTLARPSVEAEAAAAAFPCRYGPAFQLTTAPAAASFSRLVRTHC